MNLILSYSSFNSFNSTSEASNETKSMNSSSVPSEISIAFAISLRVSLCIISATWSS